ncbi:unnamed protein product [Bathycoccus prasinos]
MIEQGIISISRSYPGASVLISYGEVGTKPNLRLPSSVKVHVEELGTKSFNQEGKYTSYGRMKAYAEIIDIELHRSRPRGIIFYDADMLFVGNNFKNVFLEFRREWATFRSIYVQSTSSRSRLITWLEHKFVKEWADDPNKKAFRKLDVVPKDCPSDVYNLWDGPRVPFEVDYFSISNPEKKSKTALVFQSKEGSGKNEFWGFIGKLTGKGTYVETSNAERDIFEKHSLALQGR